MHMFFSAGSTATIRRMCKLRMFCIIDMEVAWLGNMRYIGQHYDEDLSLEKVACEMYISYTYLSRILKEKTNQSFLEWLHYFRIERAKELLCESDLNINKIAEICGYNSYKVLSENFRRLTGITATEYRAKNSGLDKENN